MDILLNNLRVLLMIGPLFVMWYIWSLQQRFVPKKENREEMDALRKETYKQGEEIRELKTHIPHILSALQRIEDKVDGKPYYKKK